MVCVCVWVCAPLPSQQPAVCVRQCCLVLRSCCFGPLPPTSSQTRAPSLCHLHSSFVAHMACSYIIRIPAANAAARADCASDVEACTTWAVIFCRPCLPLSLLSPFLSRGRGTVWKVCELRRGQRRTQTAMQDGPAQVCYLVIDSPVGCQAVLRDEWHAYPCQICLKGFGRDVTHTAPACVQDLGLRTRPAMRD